MQPPGIFLLDARNPHHAACIRLAAQITAKCPQHPLDVNPIGLGAPRPPVHQQARRIENMITHPMSFEPAVQPEPVIAGLVARHHLDRSAQLSANLLANPFDQLEQAIGSSCCSMGSAHPPPNWPCSIQLQSGSGQGHHCGRSTWCLPNGLPSVSPMQGWWWFVYTALVPPRWPRLHRILTRQSILVRRRWIRGSSPRVTGEGWINFIETYPNRNYSEPTSRRCTSDLVRDRERLISAFQEFDRHENHVAVADVLKVMHLEFTGPIGLVTCLAGRIGVFDRGAVHQVLAAAAWRDRGPEIIEHMPVKAEPLSRLEPDGPYPDLVGFRNQLAAYATIGAAAFAGELFLQRGRPF